MVPEVIKDIILAEIVIILMMMVVVVGIDDMMTLGLDISAFARTMAVTDIAIEYFSVVSTVRAD